MSQEQQAGAVPGPEVLRHAVSFQTTVPPVQTVADLDAAAKALAEGLTEQIRERVKRNAEFRQRDDGDYDARIELFVVPKDMRTILEVGK